MVAKSESKEARELIAYAQIIVQMARRHRGSGWLLYDQNFRQQAAGGAETPWSEINNSLLVSTVLASQVEGTAKRSLCAQCQGVDHSSSECALGTGRETKTFTHPTSHPFSRKRPSQLTDQICRNFNRNACMADPCKYNHTCLGCFRPGHSIRDCQDFIKGKGKAPTGDKIFHPKGSQRSSTN